MNIIRPFMRVIRIILLYKQRVVQDISGINTFSICLQIMFAYRYLTSGWDNSKLLLYFVELGR